MRVTNLSEDAQEADLRDLFGFFGQIRRIFLAKDKITQQSKVEGEDATWASSLVLNQLYHCTLERTSLGTRSSKNRKGESGKWGGVEVYTAEC